MFGNKKKKELTKEEVIREIKDSRELDKEVGYDVLWITRIALFVLSIIQVILNGRYKLVSLSLNVPNLPKA